MIGDLFGLVRCYVSSPLFLFSPLLLVFEPAFEEFLVVASLVMLFVAVHVIVGTIRRNKEQIRIVQELLREYAKYSVMVGLNEDEVAERVQKIRSLLGIKSDDSN